MNFIASLELEIENLIIKLYFELLNSKIQFTISLIQDFISVYCEEHQRKRKFNAYKSKKNPSLKDLKLLE